MESWPLVPSSGTNSATGRPACRPRRSVERSRRTSRRWYERRFRSFPTTRSRRRGTPSNAPTWRSAGSRRPQRMDRSLQSRESTSSYSSPRTSVTSADSRDSRSRTGPAEGIETRPRGRSLVLDVEPPDNAVRRAARIQRSAARNRALATTTKHDQSTKRSTARTRIDQRIRLVMAGRTGLEPTTSGCNPAETQGSEQLKFVSRCIPTSPDRRRACLAAGLPPGPSRRGTVWRAPCRHDRV